MARPSVWIWTCPRGKTRFLFFFFFFRQVKEILEKAPLVHTFHLALYYFVQQQPFTFSRSFLFHLALRNLTNQTYLRTKGIFSLLWHNKVKVLIRWSNNDDRDFGMRFLVLNNNTTKSKETHSVHIGFTQRITKGVKY